MDHQAHTATGPCGLDGGVDSGVESLILKNRELMPAALAGLLRRAAIAPNRQPPTPIAPMVTGPNAAGPVASRPPTSPQSHSF